MSLLDFKCVIRLYQGNYVSNKKVNRFKNTRIESYEWND